MIKKITFLLFAPIMLFAQQKSVTLSGKIQDKVQKTPLAYVNVVLKTAKDSTFVAGTITNEAGLFLLPELKQGSCELPLP